MARVRLKKVFALLLAASMTISMVTAGVAAAGDGPEIQPSVTLSGITLPESVSSGLSVAYGTELEDVLEQLPATLTGTVAEDPVESEDPVETEAPAETEAPVETEAPTETGDTTGTSETTETETLAEPETVDVPVTWSCADYDGWTAGDYTFTATLGAGYTYGGALSVTVTVATQTGAVARIGEATYDTLDAAIAAAKESTETDVTIEVLQSCKITAGISVQRDLTIQAAEELEEKPVIFFDGKGIFAQNCALTFESCVVNMVASDNPAGSGGTTNLIDDSNLTFIRSDVTIVNDHADTGGESAIYLYQGSNLYIQDQSTFMVSGYKDQSGDSGIYADGSERDDSLPHFQIVISGGSTALIQDCAWGGMTINPCDLTVSGSSSLTISNCGVNGGKQGLGCYYGGLTVEDHSKVDISNNAGSDWGAFVGGLTVDGTSELKTNSNGGYGIAVGGPGTIASGAKFEACDNADSGLRVYVSGSTWKGDVTIGSGADVTLLRNQKGGVYNQGTLNMSAGTVMNNSTATNGGGINNTGTATIGNDVIVYNNHANKAGDDIYSTGTITFGAVGADWALDGDPDCTDAIDGWYQDGADNRWSAHSAPLYAYEFTGYGTAVTGALALKAAHGLAPLNPDDPQLPEWETSKSKTATNLDANYESQVTLSLPAAQETLESDVVFVLDKSTSAEVEEQMLTMLNALNTQAKETKAVINVGVVIFNKVANNVLELTELNDANMAAIEAAVKTSISSGTNTHAGLLAGKAMLDADTGVAANRKYLVFVSDGITYMYNAEPTVTAWSFFADAWNNWAGPDNWNSKYGSNNAPADWSAWLSDIGAKVAAQGTTYEYSYGGTATTATPQENWQTAYANSIDKALYETYTTYQAAAAAGYRCYAMTATSNADYPWAASFMDYLANGENVSFTDIQNDIYYLLDAGSEVVDVIGYGDDYNFDFVNDISELTLTVGGKELSKTAISTTSYGFGGDDEGYDFVVTYYENGQDSKSDECFVWEINVPVSNFAPVELTYTVKLAEPKTAPGTYGQYDADGSQGYAGLYTNNSAVLYPVDSNGIQGFPERFAKPTVSYTVSGGGGNISYNYYTVTVNYLDKDTGEKVAESYTSPSRIQGSQYDVTEYNAIAIDGYTYDSTSGDPLTGTLNGNKVVNVYYVAENTDIPDDDTPTGDQPDLPDDPGETDIPDDDTPTGDLPDQPGQPDDSGETDIPDGDVPTGDLPQTGTTSSTAVLRTVSGVFLCLAVVFGGVTVVLFRKEREQN